MNKVKCLLLPRDSVIDPSLLWVTLVPPVGMKTAQTWITHSLLTFVFHCNTALFCWQVAEVELEWKCLQLVLQFTSPDFAFIINGSVCRHTLAQNVWTNILKVEISKHCSGNMRQSHRAGVVSTGLYPPLLKCGPGSSVTVHYSNSNPARPTCREKVQL